MHVEGNKILVTGGTGLVGSYLLLHMARRNIFPKALYRTVQSIDKTRRLFNLFGENKLFQQITWVSGDITDHTTLDEAFNGVKTVFHVAGKVSFAPSDKNVLYRVNVEGTANMVNMALEKGVDYFLHVSSVAALNSNTNQITEDVIWSWNIPYHHYASSKYLGEMEVWRGMQEGLNACIVNPSVVIGPGFWSEGFGQVVQKLYSKKLPFVFPGITGYVDARDVAKMIWNLFEQGIHGERFILNSENKSFKEVIHILAGELGVNPPSFVPPEFLLKTGTGIINFLSILTGQGKPIDPLTVKSLYSSTFYSNEKITKTLSEKFIPVEESLKFTAEYFLKEQKKLP